jgi:glycosyltransferase involved in cell wall biosynthesis
MLAESLVARGHKVLWWTSSVNHFTKRRVAERDAQVELSDRLTLRFLDGRLYERNFSVDRFLNHRDIARDFQRLSSTLQPPDVIFSSFPPIELCAEAVAFAERVGVPCLIDINDLWPDEIVQRVPRPLQWLAKLGVSPLRRTTARLLGRAAGISAISESYLAWALRMAQRSRSDRDGVFPLGYASGGSKADSGDDDARTRTKVFLFVGTFVNSIDLDTVLAAATRVQNRADIKFLIVGDGERKDEWLRAGAGLTNVEFTGWASRDQIATHAARAYAGLGAYRQGALMSLPNKIYEYLSFGLPILISLPGEARELVESSGCGLYYKAGDGEALAAAVLALADDPERQRQMANSARRLFDQRFAEPVVYSRLADYLERSVGIHAPSPGPFSQGAPRATTR